MNTKNYTMKELPDSEKPYEKCEEHGAQALSDAELLAVLIKNGTRKRTSLMVAMDVLQLHPSYKGLAGLYHLTIRELVQVRGIGKVKAIQILCMAELAKRMAREKRKVKAAFSGPADVAMYFMEEMRNLETEHFYAAFMDAGGHLLYSCPLFKGTVLSSPANPREILRAALLHDAAQYVVLHNHPSGDPTPSRTDIQMTGRLAAASELVGIPLKDHIIIGDNQYVSLKEQGSM